MGESNRSLRTLKLRGNDIRAAGATDFACSLRANHCLTSLDLSTNEFSDSGAEGLIKGLEDNWALKELSIFSCDVSREKQAEINSVLERNSGLYGSVRALVPSFMRCCTSRTAV